MVSTQADYTRGEVTRKDSFITFAIALNIFNIAIVLHL